MLLNPHFKGFTLDKKVMKKLLKNLSNSEMNLLLDEVAREHPEYKSSVDVIKSQFPAGEQSVETKSTSAIDTTQPQPLTPWTDDQDKVWEVGGQDDAAFLSALAQKTDIPIERLRELQKPGFVRQTEKAPETKPAPANRSDIGRPASKSP